MSARHRELSTTDAAYYVGLIYFAHCGLAETGNLPILPVLHVTVGPDVLYRVN